LTSILSTPTALTAFQKLEFFECGQPALDEWLQKRALANHSNGASRVYVICENNIVIGYYVLAMGSVSAAETPGKIKRNMPDPIPVMILARLAIDKNWQGKGIGKDLLRDAILRTIQAANIGGIKAILVHYIDERAAQFYTNCGFLVSPIRPLTLFLPLSPLPSKT
jgi:GNAT superfamily N-acetyltransferase